MFHVYDRKHLDRTRRYTVEAGIWSASGTWRDDGGDYDLWLLAPNGFHMHFIGRAAPHPADPEIDLRYHGDNITGATRAACGNTGCAEG